MWYPAGAAFGAPHVHVPRKLGQHSRRVHRVPKGIVKFLKRTPWNPQTAEFVLAATGQLFRGHSPLAERHRPHPGHRVPADFIGICVATSADPGCDAYVVDRLRDLDIRHVRLDYGYESPGGHGERLLNALLEHSFQVLLHVVQPPGEAGRMSTDDAQRRWQRFVAQTLDRYGDVVEAVEFGSTVNRRRWAGYSLEGFLNAWNVAHDEARRRGVKIAGPNVTDFEPLFTAGLLRLLARSNRLPDVYTNNLFVERVVEPEAFDHRIAGRVSTHMLRLNLVKKSRHLQETARRHGIEAVWNGYVSWTHPRIARRLAQVEQKQADYLSRYLLLMAAAGSTDRVYWGPLVSRREGLIDDPSNPDGREELVNFYGTTHGPASTYRPRLALDALRQVTATVPGREYLGRLVEGDGLEVHGFAGADGIIHAAWTRNGAVARFADVYAADDLAAAAWQDRDGQDLAEPPSAITEAPTYLCWPSTHPVAVNAGARTIAGLAIDRYHPGGQHIPFVDGRWRGMVVARDADHGRALLDGLHPDRLGALTPRRTLRVARNAIWTVTDPADEGRLLVIKQPVKLRLHKRLIERFRPSKAARSFSGASELLRRGFASPLPVAYFERDDKPGLTENWYMCEYQDGCASVRDYFSAYARGDATFDGLDLRELLTHLVPFLVRLHNRGVFFRDLSGGNVLVARDAAGGMTFSLIDTARARFSHEPRAMMQRLSDLKRLCHKLHWEGRALLLEQYLAAIGRTPSLRHRVPFLLYDLKAGLKRRARGKHRGATRRAFDGS
jgi:hypothetical protein